MSYVCAVFGISNVIGLLLTISVEVPISNICKLIFLKGDKPQKRNANEMKMNENSSKMSP